MELKEAITKGFEKLESLTECNWPDNKRVTREKLIEAFSQTEVKPYEYLGYENQTSIGHVIRRAVKDLNKLKKTQNQILRNFILDLTNQFLCYKCYKVYNNTDKYPKSETQNICKSCCASDTIYKSSKGRQYIYDYLRDKSCVDCGETNPIVLEFDHRNPKLKVNNVSNLVRSMEKLKIEITKCDVVCANCHRIRTAKQQDWYKHINTN